MLKVKMAVNFIFDNEFKAVAMLSSFLVVGIAVGSLFSARLETGAMFTAFILSGSFQVIALKTLTVLSAVFLLGYTAVGAPLVCFALMYWGTCCGVFMSSAAAESGFRGVAVYGVILSVYFLISFFSLVFLGYSSLRMSLALFGVFRCDGRSVSPKVYSRPHVVRFAFFTALELLSCAYCSFAARPVLQLLF